MKPSYLCLVLFLMIGNLFVGAQTKQNFSIVSFTLDQSSKTGEREDSDGYPMALIKVTSNDPESLNEYVFNFGNQYSVKDSRDHAGELWLYVQRNAKRVKITRGNAVVEYDLKPMVEAGKVYDMFIKGPERVMRFQMIRFEITPKMEGATVFIKGSDGNEELLGTTDVNGSVAKNLRHDRYTYRVLADQYKESQGEFTLTDENNTHTERVTLRPNFAEVTLTVDADADIYINNEKRGHKTWTGRLSAGDYQIECRQENHRPSRQIVTVVENDNRTFTLDKPTPITGKLSINSSPLDAKITIDGRDYGTTPRNLDIIIGKHNVTVSKLNHQSYSQTVEVKQGQTVEVNAKLNSKGRITINSKPSGATLFIDGENKGATPYTAEMASGEYRIKLARKGYNTLDKRVHLDVSNPDTAYTLQRQYFKPSGGLLSAGFQVGGLTGPMVSVGAYISNVFVEAFGCMGMQKERVYALDVNGYEPRAGSLAPLALGAKLGYGVMLSNRLRLTPQAGYCVISAKDNKIASISTGSAVVGAKLEYAFAPNFSVFATPQYRFAVVQGEAYKKLADMSSTIKEWNSGFDAVVGLSVNF